MQSILPSNNSPLMHALAQLSEQQIAALDWRVILLNREAATCQTHFLPYLAWENSIADAEGWGFAETESAQRNLIQNYVAKHQHKGTPAMIRVHNLTCDGSATFDGNFFFGGGSDDWAKYAIVLKRVVSIAQAEIIKQFLAEITPLRCELVYLDYRSNPLYWNAEIAFDGTHTFGAITS